MGSHMMGCTFVLLRAGTACIPKNSPVAASTEWETIGLEGSEIMGTLKKVLQNMLAFVA